MAMQRTWIVGSTLVAIASLVVWFLLQPDSPPDLSTAAQAVDGTSVARASNSHASPSDMISPAPPTASLSDIDLPPSLAGTEIDGAVELDANGLLKPSQSLRRLFDQVLTLLGERSIEQIRALLASRLNDLTTPDGKRQVLAAFERYLRYLQAQADAAPAMQAMALEERLASIKALRRQQLGAEMADAFFAEDEAYQDFTLAGRALRDAPNLSPEERAEREQALIDALPDSARQPLIEQRATEAALSDAQRIEMQVQDPQERTRLRSERFGAEAAVRMQALDQERALWRQRIDAYRSERTQVRARGGTTAAQEAALSEYLSRQFDEAEQRRIRSLEAIGEI